MRRQNWHTDHSDSPLELRFNVAFINWYTDKEYDNTEAIDANIDAMLEEEKADADAELRVLEKKGRFGELV